MSKSTTKCVIQLLPYKAKEEKPLDNLMCLTHKLLCRPISEEEAESFRANLEGSHWIMTPQNK